MEQLRGHVINQNSLSLRGADHGVKINLVLTYIVAKSLI